MQMTLCRNKRENNPRRLTPEGQRKNVHRGEVVPYLERRFRSNEYREVRTEGSAAQRVHSYATSYDGSTLVTAQKVRHPGVSRLQLSSTFA